MPANYVRRYRHKQVYPMTQMTPADPARVAPHVVFQAHTAKVQDLLVAVLAVVFASVPQLRVTCIQLIAHHCCLWVLQLSNRSET